MTIDGVNWMFLDSYNVIGVNLKKEVSCIMRKQRAK